MSKLCLALDLDALDQAQRLVEQTAHVFEVYKIGLELFTAYGWSAVDAVKSAGAREVFLDLKLHDIPRTVLRTISRMEHRGVDYLTLHLGGGGEMLRESQTMAENLGIRLLGVSVLTSLDAQDLRDVGMIGSPLELALKRSRLATECGLYGVVASALECATIKAEFGSKLRCVTPGIRFDSDAIGDQKRVLTPEQALQVGSDMLVVGRAITNADDLNHRLMRLKALKE